MPDPLNSFFSRRRHAGQERSRWGAVLLLLFLTGVLPWVFIGESARASDAGTQPGTEEAWRVFSHDKHVADDWWEGGANFKEQPMDCRGCHAVGGLDPLRSGPTPTALCEACHPAGFRDYQGAPRLRQDGDAGIRFRHGTHNALDCAKCHHPSLAGLSPKEGRRVLAVPMSEGASYCARCHSRDSPEFMKDIDDVLHAGTKPHRAVSMKEFSHLGHVVGFDKGTPLKNELCSSCHKLQAPDGQLLKALPVLDTSGCYSCHAGVTFEHEKELRPDPLHGAFLHANHTGVGSSGQNCSTCHLPGSEGMFASNLASESSGSAYKSCASCHEGYLNAPRVPEHSDELFQDCTKCHGAGGGESLAWDQFSAGVGLSGTLAHSRTRYGVSRDSHAKWLDSGELEDCWECHHAEEFPKRAKSSSALFDHQQHLSQSDPKEAQEQCATCHIGRADPASTVEGASPWSDGIRDGVVGTSLTACAKCHLDALSSLPRQTEDLVSPRFLHADHLNKTLPLAGSNGRPVTCTDCHHNGSKAAGGEVSALPAVAACVQCHGHKEGSAVFPPAERFALADAGSCQRCHSAGYPVEGGGASRSIWALTASSPDGPLHNPEGLDCKTCHIKFERRMAIPEGPERYRPETLSGWQSRRVTVAGNKLLRNPHLSLGVASELRKVAVQATGVTVNGSADKFFGDLGSQIPSDVYKANGTYCLHCHWNSVEKPSMNPNYDNNKEVLRFKYEGRELFKRFGKGESSATEDSWQVGLPGIRALFR